MLKPIAKVSSLFPHFSSFIFGCAGSSCLLCGFFHLWLQSTGITLCRLLTNVASPLAEHRLWGAPASWAVLVVLKRKS